jgi:phage shock protein A
MASVGTTWRYIKARVAGRVEERMDPAIQIEQAVDDARKQDAEFRMQAARVIANRTEVQMQLDRAVDRAATLKEQAGQALRQADAAAQAGDVAAVDKWTRSAQTLAMQLESAESLVETLMTQYRAATEQAEIAKEQVNQNALRLDELTARRLELLGKLEQAKMQERVNATLETLSRPVDTGGPTLREIEDKIDRRMALASAHAELAQSSVTSGQVEIDRAMREVAANARLTSLRQELGIEAPAAAAEIERPAAPALEGGANGDGADAEASEAGSAEKPAEG